MKKGITIFDRILVSHMAQMQNMLDFPPAPKLDATGRLDPAKATEQELRGEQIFYGKGRCGSCHMPPAFLDHQMHDLHVELSGRAARRPDQDLHAARHQGEPAVPARRAPADARGHGGVLQPRAALETRASGEGGSRRVHAAAVAGSGAADAVRK